MVFHSSQPQVSSRNCKIIPRRRFCGVPSAFFGNGGANPLLFIQLAQAGVGAEPSLAFLYLGGRREACLSKEDTITPQEANPRCCRHPARCCTT